MNVPIPNVYHPAGTFIDDPTKTIKTMPGNTASSNGLFSQIKDGPYSDPWNPIHLIEERLKKLETENKFLRLKILSIEGKFSHEEVTNIRKMLISEDEASRTLAESIIDNA